MTKMDLVDKLFERSQARKNPIYPSHGKCNEALNDMLEVISEALAAGETVTLTGFGTFEVRDHAARIGVNPRKPGEKMEIPAARRPHFSAGRTLKNKVNVK